MNELEQASVVVHPRNYQALYKKGIGVTELGTSDLFIIWRSFGFGEKRPGILYSYRHDSPMEIKLAYTPGDCQKTRCT